FDVRGRRERRYPQVSGLPRPCRQSDTCTARPAWVPYSRRSRSLDPARAFSGREPLVDRVLERIVGGCVFGGVSSASSSTVSSALLSRHISVHDDPARVAVRADQSELHAL